MSDKSPKLANPRPAKSQQAGIAFTTPAESGWTPGHNPWLIAVVVALAAFMEVLDISIANVALPHIAGGFAATNDESTWVLTSYLVSNAIVLPISGWFARTLGRKRFFIICLVLFTASSMLCGAAPSLAAMIVFRIMQGLGGGGLQPMAQAIMADSFPAHRRGLAFALYGVTVVIAPIIGPTLGGWITDSYTWRWIFFINLPVGLLAMALIARLVEDPPYLMRARANGVKIDYIGVALLVLGVGALQIMLDKGQEDDWFGSHFILALAIIAVVCLTGLGIWDWFYKEPIIEMRLFKNLSYLSCNLMIFAVGVVLFSSLVMLPQFMQTLMGYTATSAGLVLSTSGVISLLELPLVGKLTTKVQARYLAAFGSLLVAPSECTIRWTASSWA
jgi:DHA2 family multidrug resistance protein